MIWIVTLLVFFCAVDFAKAQTAETSARIDYFYKALKGQLIDEGLYKIKYVTSFSCDWLQFDAIETRISRRVLRYRSVKRVTLLEQAMPDHSDLKT